jgi:hypothetical protein
MDDMITSFHPGLVALFGSGETSPMGGQVFEAVAQSLAGPLRVGILETPAGFELNSPLVAGRVGTFLSTRLQNYHPEIEIIAARKKGSEHSPDDPTILAPLADSSLIFLGPGSPTYAVRQLRDSLAWEMLRARHRLGAALALASAATVAFSARTIPVHEIFKVGEDPHWIAGLDFFRDFGLNLVIVPHWNNSEGGADLDTSRCFIGRARFDPLEAQLPAGTTVLGIDENTGVVLDLDRGDCAVLGRDSVHVRRAGQEQTFASGERFPIGELGDFRLPQAGEGISARVWDDLHADFHARVSPAPVEVPEEVQRLIEQRQAARARRDWRGADRLRMQIGEMGWRVTDTPEGTQVDPC